MKQTTWAATASWPHSGRGPQLIMHTMDNWVVELQIKKRHKKVNMGCLKPVMPALSLSQQPPTMQMNQPAWLSPPRANTPEIDQDDLPTLSAVATATGASGATGAARASYPNNTTTACSTSTQKREGMPQKATWHGSTRKQQAANSTHRCAATGSPSC